MAEELRSAFSKVEQELDKIKVGLRSIDGGLDGLSSSIDKMADRTLIFGLFAAFGFVVILVISLVIVTHHG